MNQPYQSLAHSKWACKDHVVFVPKRRRKVLYGELRRQLGVIFHEMVNGAPRSRRMSRSFDAVISRCLDPNPAARPRDATEVLAALTLRPFRKAPLLTYVANSLLYAGLATLFMLMSSVPAAYALSRFEFRWHNGLFLAVIAMMVLPPQVTQVPIYLMWAKLGLTGTLWPLILPNLLGDAFSIFLLRQFLLTIPEDYADAARIDGCSEWAVMTRIILPMAKPALAATAMFMFFVSWNDYYGPLLYTSENAAHWTVSLGLAQFRTNHNVQWNLTMAATVLMMLPVIVLFFFAQKAFVQGVTLTGVKG